MRTRILLKNIFYAVKIDLFLTNICIDRESLRLSFLEFLLHGKSNLELASISSCLAFYSNSVKISLSRNIFCLDLSFYERNEKYKLI